MVPGSLGEGFTRFFVLSDAKLEVVGLEVMGSAGGKFMHTWRATFQGTAFPEVE